MKTTGIALFTSVDVNYHCALPRLIRIIQHALETVHISMEGPRDQWRNQKLPSVSKILVPTPALSNYLREGLPRQCLR